MVYAGMDPVQSPPCAVCRIPLERENWEAASVYMTVRRQYVTGEYGRIVDINILTVLAVMDLYGVSDKQDCLRKVLKTFYHMRGKSIEGGMESREVY